MIDQISQKRLVLCAFFLTWLCFGFQPLTTLGDKKTREALLKTPMPDWPAEPMSEVDRKKATKLFGQMVMALGEIKSGIVDGEKFRFVEREQDEYTETHNWHLVFDDAGRKRFRNITSGRTLHYIHTGQEILTMIETPLGRPRPYPIYRNNPDTQNIIDDARPPHLERIGFAGGALLSLSDARFNHVQQTILERSPQEFVGLRETKENLILLMKEFNHTAPRNDQESKMRYRSAFWIDPEKGHRQVKFAEWRQTAETADWTLINVGTVNWRKINECYVPAYNLYIANQNPVSGHEFKLNWKSANMRIENAEFEWQKFNPPIGTEIVNMKTGERIVESRVGDSP